MYVYIDCKYIKLNHVSLVSNTLHLIYSCVRIILFVTLLSYPPFYHLVSGVAEQCKIPSGSQEADDRQTAGPMPPPCPAQRGPPQGLGDIWDHLQDHWTQEAGQRPLSLQVIVQYHSQQPIKLAGHFRLVSDFDITYVFSITAALGFSLYSPMPRCLWSLCCWGSMRPTTCP